MGKITKGSNLTYPFLSVIFPLSQFDVVGIAFLYWSLSVSFLFLPCFPLLLRYLSIRTPWSGADKAELFVGQCLDFPNLKQLIFESQVPQRDPHHTVMALVTLLNSLAPRNLSEVFLYLFQEHRSDY